MNKRHLYLGVSGLGIGFFLVCCALVLQAGVQMRDFSPQPVLAVEPVVLPEVSAAAAYVLDIDTRLAVFEREADTQRPIASVTKLFSGAMFFGTVERDATTTITWADLAPEGRAGRLEYGAVMTNHELLFPALLESSNDASAVMRRVTNEAVITYMNEYADAWNAPNTSFADASGLSSRNVSTARELAEISVRLYEEYPHIFDITQLSQYLGESGAWLNNNPFVGEPGYAGGKHGYTHEANRTAVAFFDEVLPSGSERRFVYVLLGSDDLASDMSALRTYVTEQVDFR